MTHKQGGMKKVKFFIAVIIIYSFFSSSFSTPAEAAGAFFYLSPAVGTKSIDTAFTMAVKLNTGESVINAAEGTLSFDSGKLEVTSISKSGSIFSVWTTDPTYNNAAGTISFAGGVPRPGYSGRTGTVITISFKAKAAGEAQINFSSGAILANDGLGTNILTSMGGANFTISPKSTTPTEGATSTEPAKTTTSQTLLNNNLGIISTTHPNSEAWSNRATAEFKWNLPGGTTQISTAFNNEPATDPGNKAEDPVTSKRYDDVKDGVWYFHIKARVGKDWTPISHYKIQIDSTPPTPFKIEVEQKFSQDLPVLYFKASDGTSGIVRYEINIGSLEEKGFVVDSNENMLKVPSLEVGPHTAMVKAIDAAGNEVISTIEFIITPIDTPVIKNFSNEIKPSDKFFISGSALGDVTVNIYMQKDDGKVITKKTISDKTGSWYLVTDSGLANGRYVAWVEAINANGLRSEPSSKVSFLVSPPIFTRLGSYVINYFTLFVSLLFMVILIIASIIFLTHMIKKRLKKETIEVEDVLRDNMDSLRDLVELELARLDKLKTKEAINKEKARLKVELREKIETTERKIMKEIKDVEKLLK